MASGQASRPPPSAMQPGHVLAPLAITQLQGRCSPRRIATPTQHPVALGTGPPLPTCASCPGVVHVGPRRRQVERDAQQACHVL